MKCALLLAISAFSALAQTVNPTVTNARIDRAFVVTRFADRQYVESPIALSMDESGALFVAEARRFHRGVEDTRSKSFWMMDELAIQSTADRLAQYEKWTAAGKFTPDHFTNTADRIVKIRDSDGDGTADVRSMFSDSFHEPLDGNGASVLVRDGKVYYANIPHIWLLEDADDDGIADSRRSLQDGFGLRSGVNGHDMHGLEWGPDGKLYWSIGDRGYNIVTKEGKRLKDAESGAIFRCDPDGSHIELYSRGNRNPQDLAFDAYGNLFTVDNNQGGGDRSRVCYLVEGGDHGWNSGCTNTMTFRSASGLDTLKGPRITQAYMAEGLWKQPFPEQPAHVIPAVDYIDGGSAGLSYIPGASLGNHFPQHFLFSACQRGVKSFAMATQGAGFRMVDYRDFYSRGFPLDTEIGLDGEVYIADYKSEIYLLKNPLAQKRPSVRAAADLLRKPLAEFANDALFAQLAQRDQRVRLRAQFELVRRRASDLLVKAATSPVPDLLDAPVEVDPEPDEPEPQANSPLVDRQLGPWSSLHMGPPSATDAAAGASVTWVDAPDLAKPHVQAGADGPRLPRLTDGLAAANDDDTTACVWLDSKPCRLIMNLGSPTNIAQVHSYSWHKGDRAPQRFSLYGGSTIDDWQLLGEVDTRALGNAGKHGSVIGEGESMGRFQFLMWHCFTDSVGSFFTEFDVYRPGEAPLPAPVAITQRIPDDAPWDSLAIGAPTAADFANRPEVSSTWDHRADFAAPHAKAGTDGPNLPRLTDGESAAHNDDTTRCVWLDGKPYALLMDLGSVQPIRQVHSYSWHHLNRAPQKFTLLGSADDEPETWTQIAEVDTSHWGEGGKHASVVYRKGGALGDYRHLKWQVSTASSGTFFTEFDIYTTDQIAPEIKPVEPPIHEAEVTFEPFNGPFLRRLHGIWGLGQLRASEPLIPLLDDPSFRIRGQSARTLGDIGDKAAAPRLLTLLQDESPRVQYFAAIALGKIRHRPAIPALVDLLARTDNTDPYLRHAAIYGLELIGGVDLIEHDSAAVRLAILVLLRRAKDARIARYLDDPDPRLVREAIAAINDARIDAAEPALANHLASYVQPTPVLPSTLSFDRMINAAFRQGQLATLLAIGAAEHLPERVRSAALFRLGRWTDPFPVDPTLGQLRDYPTDRSIDTSPIPVAIKALIPAAQGQVRSACYHLADVYQIQLDAESLRRQILSTASDPGQRLQALASLLQNPPAGIATFLETLVADKDPFLRVAALQALVAHAPVAAEPHLVRFAEGDNSLERQAAYTSLGSLQTTRAAQLLIDGLNELLADIANHDAAIELLDACSQREEPEIQRLLRAYRDSLSTEDPLADYRAAIAGGHAKTGETTLREHGTAACIICHSIKGKGGVVAPDLAKIGPRASGDYLLESLVAPNARVVPGFGSDSISTMPPMHDILKKHEIRDIIAYLRALNKTDVAPRVPAEVRNAGVGGHTSADLLSRLQHDVLDHHPSTVVLMVGTNDRLNSRKLIPADRYRANLATLIAGIRAIGAKVLLVTPPPCVPEVLLTRHDPAAYADQAPNARMAEIRDIMLATRAPLVDFHAQVLANSALLSKDGVHLTGDGYIALAEAVAQGLHEHRLSTRQVVCLGDSLTASPYPGELRSILRGYSIGLSMYSLRQLFADGKLTALDYPAFARKTFGITEIDIWDGALPADRRADPEMYRELRKSADSAGCNIFLLMAGSLNASKPDDGKRFFAPVQHAVLLGADYLRIFLRAPTGERTASITQCIDSLRPLADFAQTKGITLVIEPGSSKATEDGSFLADLAAKMRHPALALMPDFGKLKQDPYGGTEAMLPHSPVISAKSHNFDSDGEEHDLDYPRLLKSINDAQFRGIIAIEYEGKKLGAVDGVRATQRLLERLR